MDDVSEPKPRLALLLKHFASVKDERQSWRVMYPLREVLFLVVCGTIADGDDYDDIADWGREHIGFLRGFSSFHFGVPCADWLRTLMNRVNPDLFAACFRDWVADCWPAHEGLVAIDGKTSRRSHDRRAGKPPLHLVSAFATHARLVLGQEAVSDKSNEITAIPALIERLDLKGALVSIDAMGCNPTIAQAIVDAGADYVLAVKDNQPSLHKDVESYFDTAPASEVDRCETLNKDHGRLEMRRCAVSKTVDWVNTDRAFPGARRFPKLATVAVLEATVEKNGKRSTERRSFICSRALPAEAMAQAVRGHWSIENNLHWTLDVTFGEDLSRLRAGHGAKNMALVRHFALNIVRQAKDNRAIKRRRKMASWNPKYLIDLLQTTSR